MVRTWKREAIHSHPYTVTYISLYIVPLILAQSNKYIPWVQGVPGDQGFHGDQEDPAKQEDAMLRKIKIKEKTGSSTTHLFQRSHWNPYLSNVTACGVSTLWSELSSFSLSVCVSVGALWAICQCLSVFLYFCLSVWLFLCLPACLSYDIWMWFSSSLFQQHPRDSQRRVKARPVTHSYSHSGYSVSLTEVVPQTVGTCILLLDQACQMF